MAHKIITKPFSNEDKIDKSRNVTGINRWAQSSRTMGLIMLVLGWFTIPVEVFLRRDFGQRWFTPVNFYAGFFLMVAFTAMQGVAYRIMPTIQELVWPILGPHGAFYSYSYAVRVKGAVEDMLATMLLYLLFSCYHLFKIKWRNQANIPLHSYDDGTPNFQWLANIVAWILNILAAPLLWLFFYMLPRALRKGKPFPKLITDKAAFTGMFIEPAIVFFFAWVSSSVESLWLYISGFAVLIYAQWKEMAKKINCSISRMGGSKRR